MNKNAVLFMTFAMDFNSLVAKENRLKAGIVLGNIGVPFNRD